MVDVQDIIAYEEGTLTPRQVLELFAELIRTGTAFELQGHYGRTAVGFLEAGFVLPNGDITGAGLAAFPDDDEVDQPRLIYGGTEPHAVDPYEVEAEGWVGPFERRA
jgi:hypothetical protein